MHSKRKKKKTPSPKCCQMNREGMIKKGKMKKRGLGASQQGEIINFYGFCEKQRQASNFLGKDTE